VTVAQQPKPPVEVRCTNCNDSTGLIVAGLAAVVAIVALLVAVLQTRLAARQTKTTERQLAILEEERAAAVEQSRRRARIEVQVRLHPTGAYLLPDTAPAVVASDVRTIAQLEIRLDNRGERDARQANINFVAPNWLHGLRWIHANGDVRGDPPTPTPQPVNLRDTRGMYHHSEYLDESRDLARHAMNQLFVSFEVPRTEEGRTDIPFRLTVQSEDIEDRLAEFEFHLRVRTPQGSA
jgi:hypothetical protein